MNNRKRLLSLGVALSLLCTNTAFGAELIPPNPLSGGSSLTSGILNQGPGGSQIGSGAGAGGQGTVVIPGNATNSAGNNGTANGGSSVYAGPGGVSQGNSGTGAGSSNGTIAGAASQTLAGTVFQGSSAVAAPVVQAEGAVLLNCGTGQILFGKNENTQFYPASITKVMTALLTIENCNLSDMVTFSESATTNLESGAVTLDLTAGDQLTVEQCLYGLLLKSANEVANGLAEHISGSVSAFADKMNARAAQLGCRNTHFANPNGLNDATHLTTAYDMALIARAAYANPTLSKISTTTSYQMPATIKGAAKTITMGHKMNYPTDSRYYPGIVGGKTGYTSKAKNTLVTCVEKNGVRLVAVVLKASGTHYTDTKAMLDYGFALAERGEIQGGDPTYADPSDGAAGSAAGMGNAANASGAAASGTGSAASTSGTAVSNPASAASAGANSQGPGAAAQSVQAGWLPDGDRWCYVKADGSKAANEWLTVEGKEYWFDSDTHMATGWRKYVGDIWYYFHSTGELAKSTWVKSGEQWFYVGADGAMLKNTTTSDGYQLGTDGAWIP